MKGIDNGLRLFWIFPDDPRGHLIEVFAFARRRDFGLLLGGLFRFSLAFIFVSHALSLPPHSGLWIYPKFRLLDAEVCAYDDAVSGGDELHLWRSQGCSICPLQSEFCQRLLAQSRISLTGCIDENGCARSSIGTEGNVHLTVEITGDHDLGIGGTSGSSSEKKRDGQKQPVPGLVNHIETGNSFLV
jgi:hypothetical protein